MQRLELFHTLQRPQVREVVVKREDGTEDKVRRFEGYAIVWDSPSVVMCDWWDDKVFREYIDKGAISKEMLDNSDIICTAFHNREMLLARHHADGTGTLSFEVDDTGVKALFDFPNSPMGDNIAESVMRGDMPGMSFSFYESDYTYNDTKGADGIIDRHITNIASIFEVTVAANPAYPGTTANCRESWEHLTQNEKRLKEQEDAEREARHQLALREQRERELWLLSHQ